MKVHSNKNSSRSSRGATLGVTLMAIAFALVLGLAMASGSVTHLHQTSTNIRGVRASNAAETVLAEALERLVSEPEFGVGRMESESLRLEQLGAEGFLSFSQTGASGQGVPLSTNNRFGLEPIPGWDGSVVPAKSVQLYSRGHSEGTAITVECILQVPDFPYVVASSGPVDSVGSLLVGTVDSLEQVTNSEAMRSAAIASNDRIDIAGSARIFGHVESTDQINLAASVKVNGEVRPHSQAVELSDLDISSLRPSTSVPLPNNLSPELAGRYHHNGPSLSILGGLKLDDAVLYVNGDLSIQGGIQGKGAIIVNGDLSVEGASSLSAQTQLALVSQGDLTIEGDGPNSSFFQGLIYTEGDFLAEDVTLVGAFVANRQRKGDIDPGSRIDLQNTALVRFPDYGKFELDAVPFLIWGANSRESQGGRETLTLIEVDARDIPILEKAAKTVRVSGEGEGIDGQGTPSITLQKRLNLGPTVAVARGRRVTVEDGRLISQWTELTKEEIEQAIQAVEPANSAETHTHSNALMLPSPGGAQLSLMGHEADPDSLFWQEVHSSLHLDLNEFLGQHSRIRIASWREL